MLMKPGFQARQVNAQTHVPWLLINGEPTTPAQLQAAGCAGTATRPRHRPHLPVTIDDADAFSPRPQNCAYAARGQRTGKPICKFTAYQHQSYWDNVATRDDRIDPKIHGKSVELAMILSLFWFRCKSPHSTRRSRLAIKLLLSNILSQSGPCRLAGWTPRRASTGCWDYVACTPGLTPKLNHFKSSICSATQNCSGTPH